MRLLTLSVVAVLTLVVLTAAWLWTPDRPRAALESKYLQSPADLIVIDGVRLHVRDSGPRAAPDRT